VNAAFDDRSRSACSLAFRTPFSIWRDACQRSRLSRGPVATSVRGKRQPRRLASSCGKRWSTSGKANTARARANKRSRSGFPRRAAQGWICRRPRRGRPRRRLGGARPELMRGATARRRALARPQSVRVPRRALWNVREAVPLPIGHWPLKRAAPRALEPEAKGRLLPAKRREQRVPPAAPPLGGKLRALGMQLHRR
jgi:hypothetical protein